MDDKRKLYDSVRKIHNNLSWLLTRAQLDVDEIIANTLKDFPPQLQQLPDGIQHTEAQYIEAPVKALRMFISDYPKLLKTCAAPEFVKETGYGRLRDYWWSLVKSALDEIKGQVPRFSTAAVIFSFRYADKRQRDPDRFASKFILDLLTWAGIISDDNYTRVILLFTSEYAPESPGTEIIIADIFEKLRSLIPNKKMFIAGINR